jgi:glycosyltransferase involved in cell wall biosynthesis
MASGLPAVVTHGSDTGGLVVNGETGYVCGREPRELAKGLGDALSLDRGRVRESVAALEAPILVRRILGLDQAFLQRAPTS